MKTATFIYRYKRFLPYCLYHEEVEHALNIIQRLEPAGIGARNLQECLLLQIITDMNKKNELQPLFQIIFHYLQKKNGKKSRNN